MPSRLLPLVALFLVLGAAAYWWSQPTDTELAVSTEAARGSLDEPEQNPNTGLGIPNSTDLPLPTDEAALETERLVATSTFQSHVTSVDGSPLSGSAYWVEANEELVQALENKLTLAAGNIWKLGQLENLDFENGELSLPLIDETIYFCWIEVDGYRPFTWFSDRSEDALGDLPLEECPSLRIRVEDPKGAPVEGASVSIFRESDDDRYASLDWRGRLERRYFQTSGETDAEGQITFACVPDMPGTIWIKPDLPFGLKILDRAELAGEHRIEVSQSMTIRGRVTDDSGEPIPNVVVVAFQGSPDVNRAAAGEATTDENGEYFAPGVACTGLGNSVMFYKEHYDPKVVTVPFPRVGQNIELNASLRSARPLSLRFVTPRGEALSNVELAFSRGSLDWIPALPQPQEDGTYSTHTMFVPGEEYLVAVRSDGFELARVRFVAQDDDATQSILVPGVGRLPSQSPSWLTSGTCRFSSRGSGTVSVAWDLGTESPWLPIGPGQIIVDSSEHEALTLPVYITEEDCEWPPFASLSTIEFSLELLEGESVALHSASAMGESAALAVESGANTLTIGSPACSLKFKSSMRGEWVFGLPLAPDGEVIDLGDLVWPDRQNVSVVVKSESGDPVVNSLVAVSSADSTAIIEGYTDRNGTYSAGPLNTGLYRFDVVPYSSSGTPLPSASRFAYVGPNAETEVAILYGTAPPFELEVPATPTTWDGLMLQEHSSQSERSTASSILRFQGSEQPARWLAWHAGVSGELSIASGNVNRATGRMSIPPLESTRVRIDSEEAGSVLLRLAGRVLCRQALSSGGSLLLQHVGSEDLTLQWVGSRTVGPRHTLAQLLANPQLLTSTDDLIAATLSVVDEVGNPIPSVNFALVEQGESLLSNSDGLIYLAEGHQGAAATVDRPGYFPEHVSLDSNPIVLRRLTKSIEVECSQAVPTMRLEPLFELSVPLPEMHAEMTGTGPIRYKKLPAGRYRLTRWTETGAVHSESVIELSANKKSRISDGL